MEKYAYGQVKIHESSESMVYGLPKEKKELLENQLAEMTQISAPENRFGIPQTTTHYDLLSDLYKSLGYGRADMLAIEYQNRENPYLLELMLVSTLYKAAKQKISITLSLLQVVQYLEPFIIEALTGIVKHLVKPGTEELFFPDGQLPEYILQHKNKSYREHPLLLEYYPHEEVPKMVNGYCAQFAHIFNDGFLRIDELLFQGKDVLSLVE